MGVPQVALRVDGTVPRTRSSTFVPGVQATRSVSESCVASNEDGVLARAVSAALALVKEELLHFIVADASVLAVITALQ